MGPCSPCPGERNPNRDCRHRKTPPHSRRPTCRRAPSLPKTRGGSPQQALISNRSKECREECGTMVFVTIAGASFGSSSRAGRSLGRRRPASVPRRLRPNSRQTYFVILSVSEGSIWGKVTDSSSIFRSPQNDNAVVALNHFLSGTHSSARPGRLRGSHLRCEPAPGARSKTLKHSLYIVRKLRGRLEYATGGNAERWKEKMFGAAAACRDRIRLQPCEPKPRHAETRKTRSAGFGTKISPTLLSKPNSAAARATLRVTP
jgi:hypothetical protein